MTTSACESADQPPAGRRRDPRLRVDGARRSSALFIVPVGVVAVALAALAVGRYSVGPLQVVQILLAQLVPLEPTWTAAEQAVVIDVRLPRVMLAMLVGAGLATAGAALQAVFGNPIVSPQILGISSGASFGGALAIVLGLGTAALVCGSFAMGMVALAAVFLMSRVGGPAPPLTIVLTGIVIGAFFAALVALLTYLADPYGELQSLVFWLLGSLATATYPKVAVAAAPVLVGGAIIYALRWRINVLSLGDDDATALGVRPGRLRWLLLTAVAAIIAGAVAVSGVIGWVGLVVPHLARLWVGPDHRILIPVTLGLGAAYLTVIDTITRAVSVAEMPLGVLTAVIGAPVFLILLHRNRRRMWSDA